MIYENLYNNFKKNSIKSIYQYIFIFYENKLLNKNIILNNCKIH